MPENSLEPVLPAAGDTEIVVGEEGLMRAAREARERSGLTQQEVAARLDVNQSAVSRAERTAKRKYARVRLRMIAELGGGTHEVEKGLYRIKAVFQE